MALAEQRARHVKESVVLHEQRHTLAKTEPGFAGKLAKLFGWTNADRSPTSKSPLFVSPVRSRCASPIGSPRITHRTEGDDWLDDAAPMATHAENGMADVVVGKTELSKRLEVLDSPTVDGTGKSNGKESQTRSPPSRGLADPAVSLITDSANKEDNAMAGCPRCMRLDRELETALTDRTLAEAELVSMRRAVSQVDTVWKCESPGGAAARQGAEQTCYMQPEGKDGAVGETKQPLPHSGRIDSDLGLRDELGRLEERLASLGEDGVAPSKVNENDMDGQGLPKLQVCAAGSRQPTVACRKPRSVRITFRFLGNASDSNNIHTEFQHPTVHKIILDHLTDI